MGQTFFMGQVCRPTCLPMLRGLQVSSFGQVGLVTLKKLLMSTYMRRRIVIFFMHPRQNKQNFSKNIYSGAKKKRPCKKWSTLIDEIKEF